MADDSKEDLDQFLSKIDDIHRIVQNLSSNDDKEVSQAMQESDKLIKEISKTGVDRTVINKTSSQPTKEQISPDAFMSALEKDAQERTENRRKNKILADEFKTKGNDAFHQQLYDQAIDYYTEGLKIKKDYDILYTNRAQVYVKQERYEDAIHDCEWALKVTPTYIKAFVIKGKCLMNLKEFDRAKDEFIQAEEIATKNFEPIATRQCIQEVQRQREKYQREESARAFLSNEDPSTPMNLTNTLQKLNADKQPIIFYAGGLDLLCQLIKDETTRTAFRVNNGFNLFNTHLTIAATNDRSLSDSIFNLMIIICLDDDENIKQCLESKFFNNYLTRNIYSSTALRYLVDISLRSQSRLILLQKIIPNNFIQNLMKIINNKKSKGIYATKLLSNLAIESKIKQYFNNKEELIQLILILKSTSIDEQTRTTMLSLLTNLCSEKTIRQCATSQTELFQILINDLGQYENIEHELNLLGLLINLTNEESSTLEGLYKNLCEKILIKLKNSTHHQRIFTLLGNVAMHYEQAIDILIEHKTIHWISQVLQQNADEDKIRAGVRLLALCTKSNEQGEQAVANDKKLLSLIYEQLTKSKNSLLIGNSSLLLGNIIVYPSARKCLQKNPGIEKTIGQMLKLVEESWLSKAAKKNVAIFITKMVKADDNFLQEYRKLHGTEILHSALEEVEL